MEPGNPLGIFRHRQKGGDREKRKAIGWEIFFFSLYSLPTKTKTKDKVGLERLLRGDGVRDGPRDGTNGGMKQIDEEWRG